MGEYYPLMISLILIFTLGISLNLIISEFYNIDDELNNPINSWVEPFVYTAELSVKFISFPFILIVDLFEGIIRIVSEISGSVISLFSFLGITAEEPQQNYVFGISVSNTGVYDSKTLDGFYNYDGQTRDYAIFIHENGQRHGRIRVERNGSLISQVRLQSALFSSWWWFLIPFEDIYINDGGEDLNFTLIKSGTTFNNNAQGVWITENVEQMIPENRYTQRFDEFTTELSQSIASNIRIFGLLPSMIGIPLILLLLTGILYTIFKLIRG